MSEEDVELIAAQCSLKLAEKEVERANRLCFKWCEQAQQWERVAVGALWFAVTWMVLSIYLAWELYSK